MAVVSVEDVAKGMGRPVDELNEGQVAQAIEQVGSEAARLVAGLDDLVDGAVHRGRIPVGQGIHGGVQERQIRHAEQR